MPISSQEYLAWARYVFINKSRNLHEGNIAGIFETPCEWKSNQWRRQEYTRFFWIHCLLWLFDNDWGRFWTFILLSLIMIILFYVIKSDHNRFVFFFQVSLPISKRFRPASCLILSLWQKQNIISILIISSDLMQWYHEAMMWKWYFVTKNCSYQLWEKIVLMS